MIIHTGSFDNYEQILRMQQLQQAQKLQTIRGTVKSSSSASDDNASDSSNFQKIFDNVDISKTYFKKG